MCASFDCSKFRNTCSESIFPCRYPHITGKISHMELFLKLASNTLAERSLNYCSIWPTIFGLMQSFEYSMLYTHIIFFFLNNACWICDYQNNLLKLHSFNILHKILLTFFYWLMLSPGFENFQFLWKKIWNHVKQTNCYFTVKCSLWKCKGW